MSERSPEIDPVHHDVEQGRKWIAGEIDDASYFAEARESARTEAASDLEQRKEALNAMRAELDEMFDRMQDPETHERMVQAWKNFGTKNVEERDIDRD
jgi:hypothetical protein